MSEQSKNKKLEAIESRIHYYEKGNIIFKNCKFKKISKKLIRQLGLNSNVIEQSYEK